jgi:SAM-dependent methyltransferase
VWKHSSIRRVGRLMKRAAYRIITVLDRMSTWRSTQLLPPAHLRIYYYRTWNKDRFIRACEEARTELMIHGLRPEHRVLDIGSGVGNLALGLAEYLRGGYDGVEIHGEAVGWCQRAITLRYPHFRFHRADIASRAYNPQGTVSASTYRFPFADHSFDFVLLSSVFTHMLPEDVENYVREVSRLLRPGGICVASYFLLNDESRAGVDARRSFMTFSIPHASGVCRLHSDSVPEAAVALEEAFVMAIYERAGLVVRSLRRGKWWSGEAHDQDVLAVTSAGVV